MIKRELKVNLISFIIGNAILIGLFLVVFLIYPSIIKSGNMKMMNQMLEMFPKEVLTAFNMDISSIDTAFGWLKTEGFVFVLLITGFYSGYLGSNILLKEENDKTIEYLNSLPISRKKIVLNKIISGLLYIFLMILIIGLFNYIGLSISGDFDKKTYLLLSITPIFTSIVIFTLCMFISTYAHKTKKVIPICFAIVLISYFLNILSELAESTEFLKYLSIFTLADIRNVITTITINPLMPLLSISLTITFIILTITNYDKKELL